MHEDWKEIDLTAMPGRGRPVLLTQCQTYNGTDPVVTRQRETGRLRAEVRLQEAEIQGRHPNGETIGYLAVR